MPNTNDAEIWQKLTTLFREVFMRDDIELKPEMTADDIEGWDSFKQVELIIAAQEAFAIKLSTREIDSLKCVGDLARLVTVKVS
jgi:acyl carrier protein